MTFVAMPPSRAEWLANAGDAICVPLTQGCAAIISEADAEFVLGHRWFAARSKTGVYAHRTAWVGKNLTIRMHRVITGAPNGLMVDHINGNGLDNRRANLRLCRHHENSRNAGKHHASRSRFKGVSLSRTGNRWVANIWADGRLRFLGSFIQEDEAAKAYDAAARIWFGDFARVNFPPGVF